VPPRTSASPQAVSVRADALKTRLAAMPGAVAEPYVPPKAATASALIFKVMDKMFAILSVRGDAYVVLKSDPHLAEILREQYAGVGHRTHLDRRHWIAVTLDADVPSTEI
jgi:predicted DNA-binding protein (MmcQ/YjbR family)